MLSQVILSTYAISGSCHSHTIFPGKLKKTLFTSPCQRFSSHCRQDLSISKMPQTLLQPLPPSFKKRLPNHKKRHQTFQFCLENHQRGLVFQASQYFWQLFIKRNVISSFSNNPRLRRLLWEVTTAHNMTNSELSKAYQKCVNMQASSNTTQTLNW